ncbi:Aromatic/aminoadipate aminotransferase 1 [Oleoguttula sp. CCFEE 5521]
MAPSASINILPESDTSTFTVPGRLTIQSVAKRRAAEGRLVAGVAALADVERFKGRTSHLHKPKARRWDHRFSTESNTRLPSSLKGAARYLKNEGMISLGGGLPSSRYFPFEQLSARVPDAGHFDGPSRCSTLHAGKNDLAEGKSDFDISTAFNYGQGYGAAQFLRWIIEHTEIVHSPPYQDWSCTMTIGSTSAIDMGLRMFCERGDWILSEEFTFPTAVEAAAPMGIRVAGVKMDEGGLLPCALDEVLTNWDVYARCGPKPFVLYTVPTGQNPTGSTQSAQRRREIYAVARKHDLIIMEDEPYYFLQMQPYTGPAASPIPPPTSHQEFLDSLVPSYLSMDTDGRVMRLDSFSKVIAPGARVGWITASEQIIDRYRQHADVSTQGPSGMSQLLMYKLLEEQWGHTGYLDWLLHIRMEYTERRDVLLDACESCVPREIVSWVPPMAGMFHWFKVDYRKHPAYPRKSRADIEEEIFHAIIGHGTLLMKGSWFSPDGQGEGDDMYFRATYAATPLEDIQEGVRRLGEAFREVFAIEAVVQTNDNGIAAVQMKALETGLANIHVNGYINGHANGEANGFGNGYTNGYGNGYTNGGHFDGYANGHTNGYLSAMA